MLRKVLVANRGEIAVRVIRALRETGLGSVAVYSDVDRTALHVRMADEAAHVGPAPSAESYLRIEKLIAAAKRHGADAIHPGYGFLSENADFAQACEDNGLVFIGPSAESIRSVGSKTLARKLAGEAGVPVLPGTIRGVSNYEEAAEIGNRIGYPMMLKAAAGGGGKGMRRVHSQADLAAALRDASSEAARAFGNGEVYLEKLIEKPRHIEIQILGDRYGNVIHLGERECSIQRRHQKVIEECPSPFVAERPGMREAMGRAAVAIAQASRYHNAGTVEFLVDPENGAYYFLEVNTRLQVEHPVTELVTGFDLVHWQLRIAAAERLDIAQEDVEWRGNAMECRVAAEDADNQFFPSPGRIHAVSTPAGPGIRLDSGIYPGWTVPMEYDPLLAKLVTWAPTRQAAIDRMSRALGEFRIAGIKSNLGFLAEVMADPEFSAGSLHTGFIEEFFQRRQASAPDSDEELARVIAAVAESQKTKPAALEQRSAGISHWLSDGRSRLMR